MKVLNKFSFGKTAVSIMNKLRHSRHAIILYLYFFNSFNKSVVYVLLQSNKHANFIISRLI